jgi:hypothetical protein
MEGEDVFVVSDPKGTLAQRYKWAFEQQRAEFVVLQRQYDRVLEALKEERLDNKAAHHQLAMAQRERDTYAGALLNAHKAVASYENLLAAAKNASLH